MKKENPLLDKSYAFAVRVAKLCFAIQQEKKEYILTKQLLRSGTSIGSNAEEAVGGQSEKDFFHKLTISYKEARESHYWIRLIGDTDLIDSDTKEDLLQDVEELLRIIGSIQKTMRNKMNN
jgi:four helix bundle protein